MEKLLYVIIAFALFLNINADYSEEQINPAAEENYFLEDISHLIDSETADSLLVLMKGKAVITKGRIAQLTGDMFTAELIYSRIMKKDGLKMEAAAMLKDMQFDIKAYTRSSFIKNNHSIFILTEKDIGETSFADNIKLGYSYREFIAGNFRIKTGRGLLFDWSDHSLSARPLFSNRIEQDMSLSEFPSFTGICWSRGIGNFIISGFASYNTYDSRKDSADTVLTVYTYSIHDDSLAVSRKDNLSEMLAGTVLRVKGNALNCGAYVSYYSDFIKDIDSKYNSAFSVFGEKKPFSYDMAYSMNGGWACTGAFSKQFKYANFRAGLVFMKDYYNMHSLNLLSSEKCFESRISLKKPLRLILENTYDFSDGDFKTSVTYKPFSFISFNLKNSDDVQFSVKMLGNAGIFTGSCAMTVTSNSSSIIRGDIMAEIFNAELSAFAYIDDIRDDDVLCQYEPFIPGIYPLEMLREGQAMRIGMRIKMYSLDRFKLEFALLTDEHFNNEAGLYISYN